MANPHSLAEDVGQCLSTLLGPNVDALSPHDSLQFMTECDVLNSLKIMEIGQCNGDLLAGVTVVFQSGMELGFGLVLMVPIQ